MNQSYAYISPLPLEPPSTHPHPSPWGHHRAPSWAPVLCGSFPLAICFTHRSKYMSMPLSQFFPPSPLTVPKSVSMSANRFISTTSVVSIYMCQYTIFFFFWLISVCITICTRFIHLTPTDSNSFFFMAEKYSIVYMYHNFFIHPSVNGHLGCFHV